MFVFAKARACTQAACHTASAVAKSGGSESDAFLECVPSFPKDVKEQWRKIIHEQGLVLKIGDIHAQTLDGGGEELDATISTWLCGCFHDLSALHTWWPGGGLLPTGTIDPVGCSEVEACPGPEGPPARGKNRTYQKRTSTKRYCDQFAQDVPNRPRASAADAAGGPGPSQVPSTRTGTRRQSLDSLPSNRNWNFRHGGHGCHLQSCDGRLAQ